MSTIFTAADQKLIDTDAKLGVEDLKKKYGNSPHPLFGFQTWRTSGGTMEYGEWVQTQLVNHRSPTAGELYEKMLDEVVVEGSNFNFVLMQLIRIDEAREDVASSECFISANFKKKGQLKVKGKSCYYFEKLAEALITQDMKNGYSEDRCADAVHFYKTYEQYISLQDEQAEEGEFQFSFVFDYEVIRIQVATNTFAIGVTLCP